MLVHVYMSKALDTRATFAAATPTREMSQRLTGGMLTIGVNGRGHTARHLQQCRARPDCEPLTIRVAATPPRLPGGMLTTGVNGRGHTSDISRRLGGCVQTADFLSRFYSYVQVCS